MQTIRDGLRELGIECVLGGGNVAAKCPDCTPNRKHKNRKSLSVRADGEGFLYNCHNCGFKGGWFPAKGFDGRKPYRRPRLPEYAGTEDALSPSAVAFLQSRRIPVAVAKANGLYTDRKTGMLAFPYTADGEILAVKYRGVPEKRWSQEPGCRQVLYGLDGLAEERQGAGYGEIVIVEGEMDKLAVEASGWRNVLSVPGGGGDKDVTGFVAHAAQWLEMARGFILALDDDEPGHRMEALLADRLGRHRCKVVRFGAKDPNDALISFGPDGVLDALREAESLPIPGVWDTQELNAKVKDLYRNGFKPGLSTGFSDLDAFFTVGEHCLTVVTGYPNNGKSEFVDMLAFNIWRLHGWKFAVFSPENDSANQQLRYVEKLVGKPAARKYPNRMTEEESDKGIEAIGDGFRFFRFDGDEMPAIGPILERAAGCVMRDGIKGLIIDPFNEIFQERRSGESETDYVSKMLSEVKRFAKNYGVHIFFVAHPRKPAEAATDKHKAPGLFSIAGSQHWANKADNGLSVERLENGEVVIHVTKVRDKNHGGKGSVSLRYEISTGIYTMPSRYSYA